MLMCTSISLSKLRNTIFRQLHEIVIDIRVCRPRCKVEDTVDTNKGK